MNKGIARYFKKHRLPEAPLAAKLTIVCAGYQVIAAAAARNSQREALIRLLHFDQTGPLHGYYENLWRSKNAESGKN